MAALILIVVIVMGFFALGIKHSAACRTDTVWTATTFFDYKDRWKQFQRAMKSLRKYGNCRIGKWIVVNEYAPEPKQDWAVLMQQYPWVEFIQKSADQKGQAQSLNMLLDRIGRYRYWIHWEESWWIDKPFFTNAFSIMDSTDIDQLQFTRNEKNAHWLDVEPERLQCTPEYCRVDYPIDKSFVETDPYNPPENFIQNWPLYSLRPSINRVAFFKRLGHFKTDPELWPLKFEFEFAQRFYRAGGKKAALRAGPVVRASDHTSTY